MARILLTEIPNAPQVAGPVLAPQLARLPDVLPMNLGQGLDASGIQETQSILDRASGSISQSENNIARATAATKQDMIDPAPLLAEGKAMAFAGQAIAQAGNVALDFASRMLVAKEEMDITRVDSILRDARDQYQIEIEQGGLTPDKWASTWGERQSSVMERIEALKISPRIQGRVAADTARFWADQTNRFGLAAIRQSQSDARAESKIAIERAFMDGDWEIAEKFISEKVATGLFSDAEGEEMRMKLESQQRDQLVNTAVVADPKAVLDDMEQARKDGKSSAFPWLDSAQILRVESMARGQFRQMQSDALDKLDESIIVGEFTTPEQIRAFAEQNDLPEKVIASANKSLAVTIAETPKAQAEYRAVRNSLLSEVSEYDPAADTDDKAYWAIKDKLRESLLEGDRKEALDELYARRKDGMTPSSQLQSSLFKTVDKMREQGLLGDAGMSKDGKTVTDWDKSLATEQKAIEAKEWVKELVSKNPQITPEEANAKFREYIGKKASDAAAKIFMPQQEKPGFLKQLFQGGKSPRMEELPVSPVVTPKIEPTIQDIDEAIKTLPESTQDDMSKNTVTPSSMIAAKAIVDMEARRDASGKIKLYKLPAGDGGGTEEFAGINDRYHPEALRKIKGLIGAGKQKEAEQYAAQYIEEYSAPVARASNNAGVQFALQDMAFNRGPTGATRILQKALGVKVDGKLGPITRKALENAEQEPKQLLADIREAREWYERTYAKRAPGNKFWSGLVNRWNKQLEKSIALA